MGWFSPVKGSYPSLAQVDKALPVKSGVTAIERGTILTIDGTNGKDGEWDLAKAATTKLFYVALQDYNDPTAGFAGTSFDPNGGTPVINAIDLVQDGEYETSVFDNSKDYTVGSPVYVDDAGKLTNSGTTIVGYVTRGKTDRWVNNAIAVPDQKNGATDPRLAIRTGAKKTVIRFKTAV